VAGRTQAVHYNKDASAPRPEHPISSQVDGELRELRIPFAKTRYRILYRRSRPLVVLLHIFEKETEKLPPREREIAVKRFADFKARMDAEPRRRPRAAGRDAPPRTRSCSCASSARWMVRSSATSPPWRSQPEP
jgi:phage-related protein